MNKSLSDTIKGLQNWYMVRVNQHYTAEVRAETFSIFSESLARAEQLSPLAINPEILIKEIGYFGDYKWFSGVYLHFDGIRSGTDAHIAELSKEQKERYVAPIIRGSKTLMQFFDRVKKSAERQKSVPIDDEVDMAFMQAFVDHEGLTAALTRFVNGQLSAQELAVHDNPHHSSDYGIIVRSANAFKDTIPYYNQQLFGDLRI